MTLVLGASLPNTVILGADSKTQRISVDRDTRAVVSIEPFTDRKLFKLSSAGVATYGSGPVNEPVPAVLIEELRWEMTVAEVMHFMQGRFKGADEMWALVGGWENGNPVLFDVCMDGSSPTRIDPGSLVVRGVKQAQVDVRSETAASVLALMLDRLDAASGVSVGPPFEFLVIPRTDVAQQT